MDQNYSIDEILSAVDEIQNKKKVNKIKIFVLDYFQLLLLILKYL